MEFYFRFNKKIIGKKYFISYILVYNLYIKNLSNFRGDQGDH
jgi:hypothetical protein